MSLKYIHLQSNDPKQSTEYDEFCLPILKVYTKYKTCLAEHEWDPDAKSKYIFSILNTLHIPNPLHKQCLNGMTYALNSDPVCLTVSPDFDVNSNIIMLRLQHRNYIYMGTPGHQATKIIRIYRHAFIDISSNTVHVNISS